MKWLGPVVVVLIAVLAELTVGRAAHGPDAALFFGRFHPLIVHLPIGFFLLVAAGEAATFHPKLRDRVEPVLGLLIPISAAAALGAFLMGQLLALEGGFPAQALQWHRRLTMFAVMGMAACWVAFDRQHQNGGQGRWLYRGIMGATLGLLSLGAHFGGTMTRGEAYLSKYAPGPLKPLLGGAEPKKPAAEPAQAVPAGAEPLVFKDVVLPILTEHCVECHGTEKQKGKLRLDSLEELMKGGENGATVVAGLAAKSPLLQRMLLPVSDDDRMPPEGKPSPKPEALALIEFWIERGASATLKVKDALAPSASRALLEHAAGGAKVATVPGAAAAPAPADSAAPSPAEATAAPPAEKAEPSAAPDSESAKKSAVSEPAAKPEPASAPAPAAATQPASASGAVLTGTAFLSTYCSKCHGASKQKGKLRVDSLAAMLKGGAEGPALVPGSPDKSSLVTRLRLPLSNDEHMPPAKETQPSSAEVAAFASWVRAGAGGGATAASKPAQPATVTTSTSTSGSDTTTAAVAPSDTAPSTTTPGEPAAAAPPPAGEKPSAAAAEPAPAATGPADPALLQSLPPRVTLFSDAVAPLLREKCGKCHIKDKPAGGLDVAKHAAMLEGGYSGAGIVPKDRKQSVLFARIVLPATDDERMPPEGEPALSADEVELLGAWIDQGAPAGGPTEVAALPVGAVRALSALGVKGNGPEPLASQSGGCAACSVPGAPLSTRLALQSVSLLAGIALVFAARRRRRSR